MKLKLISFDAADTLVKVDWSPGSAAIECASAIGLSLGPRHKASYDRLLRSRWTEYCDANLTNNDAVCDQFWDRMTEDWLQLNGLSRAYAAPIMSQAREWLYGEGMRYFALFDDVLECLEWAQAAGFELAVLSNWDYSLHRILSRLGIHDRFKWVVASLQVGPEKPDPALFRHLLTKSGWSPGEVVHVGDNLIDDVAGARNASILAVHLDRGRQESAPGVIRSLYDLREAIECFG